MRVGSICLLLLFKLKLLFVLFVLFNRFWRSKDLALSVVCVEAVCSTKLETISYFLVVKDKGDIKLIHVSGSSPRNGINPCWEIPTPFRDLCQFELN